MIMKQKKALMNMVNEPLHACGFTIAEAKSEMVLAIISGGEMRKWASKSNCWGY